jgi:hypothetical protein
MNLDYTQYYFLLIISIISIFFLKQILSVIAGVLIMKLFYEFVYQIDFCIYHSKEGCIPIEDSISYCVILLIIAGVLRIVEIIS